MNAEEIRNFIESVTRNQKDIAKEADMHPAELSLFMSGARFGRKRLMKLEQWVLSQDT